MTQVSSGYGGTITFTYTQTPPNTRADIWTREVVTQKVVAPGIGTSQTTSYAYVGDPVYTGRAPFGEYRGFGEVKETDAAGNYIRHWFYTTGIVDSKEAEKLKGKEYKTEYYNSSDSLIKKVTQDWSWTDSQTALAFLTGFDGWSFNGGEFNLPRGVAVDGSGNIYVSSDHRVQKFDSSHTFLYGWGGEQSGESGLFNSPRDVALDSEGNVYVVDTTNSRIQKFDSYGKYITEWNTNLTVPRGIAVQGGYVYVANSLYNVVKFDTSGNYVTSWGSYGTGDGQFYTPYGIDVDSSGNVYVADIYLHRVQKFTSSGTFLAKWGSNGSGNGQFSNPEGLAVSTEGENTYVYVADTGNNRIQKFTDTGTYQLQWGSSGTGNGQFDKPRNVAATGSIVYVTDSQNHRVQKFNTSGTYQAQWGSYGAGISQLDGPIGISIYDDSNPSNADYAFVGDYQNKQVQKFETSGEYMTRWGKEGTGDGEFTASPYGIAVSPNGSDVYAVDTGNHRVQKFTNTGTFVTKWGSYGYGNGQFRTAIDVAVSPDNNYVYVTDFQNNRVQKFTSSGSYVTQWGTYGTGMARETDSSTTLMESRWIAAAMFSSPTSSTKGYRNSLPAAHSSPSLATVASIPTLSLWW
jgi:DNA-binding beta-propeller fold protein YncE